MPETPTPLVTIVVVTWNGRDHLQRCLAALARQTWRDFCTVVVDNASADGTIDLVRREFPDVRLIVNDRNLGFAAANNIGISATDSPFVVTLNNDTVPEPSWLEALLQPALEDPTLGSVASKMVSARDPAVVDSCGIALDRAGIAWDLHGGFPTRLTTRPREVFGPCAGAALYRRKMLDDIGLFDDDFFAYLEDVDLAWRARLRGWRCVLQPAAVVRHEHAATLGDASPLKRSLLARNKVWTIAKNVPTRELLRWLPIIVLYDLGAASFGVVRQHDWASVRGRLAGLAALPRVLPKRRTIQARRTADATDVARTYSRLALPWDVPRRYRHLTHPQRPAMHIPSSSAHQNPGPARTTPRALLRRQVLKLLGGLLQRAGSRHRVQQNGPTTGGTSRPLRILVMRPDHLGDVLLSRPALDLITRSLPDAEVTVLAGPWAVASLQGIPAHLATFAFPGFTRTPQPSPIAPYLTLLGLATRLRREAYDAAIVLRPDHWWGALAAAVAGIPVRVGHDTDDVAPFLTRGVAAVRHESAVAASLRAARELIRAVRGEPIEQPNGIPTFIPTPQALASARAWLSTNSLGARPRIAIHPGAGEGVKLWPAGRWVQVIAALPPDVQVILTGAGAERALVADIQQAATRSLPAALDLSWDTLAALYAEMDVVAGMDSGPLHLATAVGTPTVRVYGPTDPEIYGPAGSDELHPFVQAALPCIPCGDLVAPPCGYLADPPCLAAARSVEVAALIRDRIDIKAAV